MGSNCMKKEEDLLIASFVFQPSIWICGDYSDTLNQKAVSAKHSGSSAFSICQTYFQHYN